MQNRKAVSALACVGLAALAAGCGSSDKKSDSTAASTSTPAAPAASGAVKAALAEYSIAPGPTSAKAGKVTFDVNNGGKIPHEFVVIKTDKKAGDLGTSKADEKGNIGEIGNIAPGGAKKLSLKLGPGHYALICNLPGHYAQGMHADFTVK